MLTQTSGAVAILDNIPNAGMVRSAQLSNLLTVETWSDRPLGVTMNVSAPNNRLWVITGNNIMLGGDLPRRALWVTIDPNHPRPEQRRFDFDPVSLIRRCRGR